MPMQKPHRRPMLVPADPRPPAPASPALLSPPAAPPFLVQTRRRRLHPHPPARRPQPQAQIHVLEMQEIPLVPPPDCMKRLAPHQEARSGNHLARKRPARLRPHRRQPAPQPPAQPHLPHPGHAPRRPPRHAPVRIEQTRPHRPRKQLLLQHRQQGRHGSRRQHCIRIQKQIRRRRPLPRLPRPHPGIASPGETPVRTRHHQQHPPIGQRRRAHRIIFQHCRARASVIHHHHGLELSQGALHCLGQRRTCVIIHDDRNHPFRR